MLKPLTRIFVMLALILVPFPAFAQFKSEKEFRFMAGDRLLVGVFRGEKIITELMNQTITLDGTGHGTLANGKKTKLSFGNIRSTLASIEEGYRTGDDLRGLDVRAHIMRHNGTPIVAILGEVATPGHMAFKPGLNLAELVKAAGGWKDGSYRKRVVLVRRGATSNVDCRDDAENAKFELEEGDVLRVDVAPFHF
jgi:protein involved in polysaccharide export with SLBB domain